MSLDIEIEVDDKTAPDYEIADNVAENLVDVIRSDMVGNEQQFLALNAAYISGLSVDPSEYLQIIVRGKSGEGKTELKQNVDSIYPNTWLLRAGSTSDQGMVDADQWDKRYIGAFAEFQQMQGKMLEMVKSSAGDDADERGVGFVHTRNVDDGDGGRTAKDIEKQSMPTVFLFADENKSEIPKELDTRQMTLRVESDEDINRGVAKTMFDHKEVKVSGRDYEYNFNFEEGKDAVRHHIANIPKPLEPRWDKDPKSGYSYPVIIPHDEGVEWPIMSHPEIDNYGWDIFKVVDDILNYKKTESKRGARAIANHIRSHARLNYHNRETMEIGGDTYIVADPQDVGNVLSYRPLLLSATHDMNEQKLAVIEALTDEENGVGAPGPNGGLQAPHKDIRGYIDEYADITSMSKSQLTNSRDQGVLDQMEEDYLIEVHEGEGENGAHLYEFLGGSTFGHPNLDIYADLFEHVTDPIRDQPISKTVADFKASLSVKTTEELLSEDPMDTIMGGSSDEETEATESSSDDTGGSLSDFSDEDDGEDVEWSEVDQTVHERLQETLDDKRATPQDVSSLDLQHMLGISPVEVYTGERGVYVRAERPREDADKQGTIMDSSHSLWGDKSDQQVETIIENSVAKLRKEEVFEVVVDEPDNPDNDDKYMMVHDLE